MWLYYLCPIGGLILLVGSMILIAQGKILIDKETKEVIALELPWFGKLHTSVPSLVLFGLGVALVIYPLHLIDPVPVQIQGQARADKGEQMEVYVAVGPDVIEKEKDTFSLRAPYSQSVKEYQVLYIAHGQLISHNNARLSGPGETVNVSTGHNRLVEIQ